MAIRLADVIENANSEFPVVEAHDQTILGFYNGFAGSAQQALELYYNGETKEEFAVSNSAGNGVKFAKLPYLHGAGVDEATVGPGDDRAVLTVEGGLFVTKDSKLFDDAGGALNGAAVYLHNTVSAGNANAANDLRSSVGRASELVQQFNRYEELALIDLNGDTSLSTIIEDNENLWLAGYDAERKRMRKFGASSLIGLIGILLADELEAGGIIEVTDTGGTGAVGDTDGDGVVGINDLLIFLNSFGNTGAQGENFVSKFRMLTGSGDQFTLSPTATPNLSGSGTDGAYNFSDFETFNFPTNYGVNHGVYGWASFTSPNDNTVDNYVHLNDRTQSSQATAWFLNKKLRAVITAKVTSPYVDYLALLIRVRIKTASNSEKFEQVYFMNPEGANNNHLFVYGVDNDSQPGQSITQSWFYSSDSPLITAVDYEPTDTNVSTSTIMQNNVWDLGNKHQDFLGSGSSVTQIEDIEINFCMFSYTGQSSLIVNRLHVYVDEEPFYFIHPD